MKMGNVSSESLLQWRFIQIWHADLLNQENTTGKSHLFPRLFKNAESNEEFMPLSLTHK
jgi:hypothetical protein